MLLNLNRLLYPPQYDRHPHNRGRRSHWYAYLSRHSGGKYFPPFQAYPAELRRLDPSPVKKGAGYSIGEET